MGVCLVRGLFRIVIGFRHTYQPKSHSDGAIFNIKGVSMARPKEELIEGIIETWEKYGAIENPNYTSSDIRKADEILDDLERLLQEND